MFSTGGLLLAAALAVTNFEKATVQVAGVTEVPYEQVTTEPPVCDIETIVKPVLGSGGVGIPPSDMTYLCASTAYDAPASQNRLTRSKGVHQGPSGREKWYNLNMSGVVQIMRGLGYDEETYPYWVRDDGVKMFGEYVMCAGNVNVRPKGTILETSLGLGMICDACVAANDEPTLLDIAVRW